MDCPWSIANMRAALMVLRYDLPKEFARLEENGLRCKPIEPEEMARLEKARRTTDTGKLRALLPSWLKRHIAGGTIRSSREAFDYRMRLPRMGTYQSGFYFVSC